MSELARLVRDALARLVNSWPQWADATPSVFRARLLDECGRDARALATLLTRVIELGITDRISATSRDARTWSSVRGTFVMTLMHDGFILPEMSAWAVDAWGVALLGTTVVLPATLDGSAPSADSLATSASRCVPPRRPPPRGVHPGTRVAMGPTHMRPARSIITLVTATSG